MHSKYIILLALTLTLAACDKSKFAYTEQYIIGSKLSELSAYSDTDNKSCVAFYDSQVHAIHTFDIETLEKQHSFSTKNPDSPHYIIANNDGAYIVDMSKKNVTIHRKTGEEIENPIRLAGTPLSAAFNSTTGHLVIYDNLSSVGILQLSPDGDVLSSWVGGPLIDGIETILAGDILPNGDLVLSLKNNQLAIIDTNTSLEQKSWAAKFLDLPHQDISWIGIVSQSQIIYQSETHIVLYDIQNNTVLDSINSKSSNALLFSKSSSPHLIHQTQSLFSSDVLYFAQNGTLKKRDLPSTTASYIQSHLDFSSGIWSVITGRYHDRHYYSESGFSESADVFKNKTASSFRIQDMLNISKIDLPQEGQFKQSSQSLFTLYPSELGFVEKFDLLNEEKTEAKLFNVPFL